MGAVVGSVVSLCVLSWVQWFHYGCYVGSMVSLWVPSWVQRTQFGFYDFIWYEFMIITITLSGKLETVNNKLFVTNTLT